MATKNKINRSYLAAAGAASLAFAALAAPQASAQQTYQDRTETFKAFSGEIAVHILAPRVPEGGQVVSLADPDLVQRSHSDYELLANAIEKVRVTHAGRLVIPNRVYYLRPPGGREGTTPMFDLSKVSDCIVDGQGSTLVFDTVEMQPNVQMYHDQRVVVSRLNIDWAFPVAYPGQFSRQMGPDGKAVGYVTIDPRWRIDPNNPPDFKAMTQYDLNNRHYFWSYGPIYDHAFPRNSDNTPRWKYLGNQRFELPYDPRMATAPEQGSTVVLTLRTNNPAIKVGGDSSDIALEDVNVYSCPGNAIQFLGAGHGFRLTRVHIDRRPDALLAPGEPPRLISSGSDGLDFAATEGQILVENSTIAYCADDGINIRGFELKAAMPPVDESTVSVKVGSATSFRVGDPVSLYHSSNLQPIADRVIGNVQFNNGLVTVVFTQPIPGLTGSPDILLSCDHDSSQAYILRGNNFHDDKDRGIVVHSPHGLIDSNRIANTASSGIQLVTTTDGNTAEGPLANDIVVSNNTLQNNDTSDQPGLANKQLYPAAIMSYANTASGYLMTPLNQNILIANNTLIDEPGMAIRVLSSKNVYVSGNTIHNSNAHPYGDALTDRLGISVERSASVTINNNHRDGTTQAIANEPGTTNQISIHDNN